MPGNYFVDKRKMDKQRLLRMLKENPDMEERKLIALFSQQTGYKLETIRQMVEELREAELI
ncbi:hypothetical protein EPN87_04585 [archaeon]|nr:MAG: hypothetical protein EPN87_04585 [archaeon]